MPEHSSNVSTASTAPSPPEVKPSRGIASTTTALQQFRADLQLQSSLQSQGRFFENASGDPVELSVLESRALAGVSWGLSNPALARELMISVDGLKSALIRTYGKLGANGRAHAVAQGFEYRLLPVNPSPDEAPLGLRELQVLTGMSKGLASKEIGRQVGLEEGTIKIYARRLFRVLRVANRAAAVAEGYRRGLLLVSRATREVELPSGNAVMQTLTPIEHEYLMARAVSETASEAGVRAGLGGDLLNLTQQSIAQRYETENTTKQLVAAWREGAIPLKVAVPKGIPKSEALAAMAVDAFSTDHIRALSVLRTKEADFDELIRGAGDAMQLPSNSRQEVILSAYVSGMLNRFLPEQDQMPPLLPVTARPVAAQAAEAAEASTSRSPGPMGL